MTVGGAAERPVRSPLSLRALSAVAVGGAAGALLRWLLGLAWSSIWSVAAINLVGAFGAGLLLGLIGTRYPLLRLLIGVGFLGGFTTFSGAMTASISAPDQPLVAVLALLSVPVLAVAAAGVGWRIGARR